MIKAKSAKNKKSTMHKLNQKQQEAADISSGSAMVIAGAGSGKTRIITHRIAKLIENGSPAYLVVALTFTNKAAKEMKERLEKLLGPKIKGCFIGTFHSYCLFLLRRHKAEFNLESFSILDTDDQVKMIKAILKKYGLEKELKPKQVLAKISMLKNNSSSEKFFIDKKIEEIASRYEAEKAETSNLDFDDIIQIVHKKLQKSKDFQERLQTKIEHILIDEYQDTNDIQHDLIKKLASDEDGKLKITSIFAVGDEDQSIYSWRGAVVENVAKFQKDFEPTKLIKVEQNYRSAQPILEAANSVIQNNSSRIPKKLWSDKKADNRIFYAKCKNEYQEAEIAAHFARQNKEETAILYRNHSQSRAIEEKLIAEQIQYEIIGGIRFYDRKEIKDLLAYLKFLYNQSDLMALSRIINTPTRGLGEKFLESFKEAWQSNQHSDLIETLKEVIQEAPERKKVSVLRFLEIFQTDEKLTSKLITKIIASTDYRQYIKNSYDEQEAEEKLKNIDEFIRSIDYFESSWTKEHLNPPKIEDFLHEIALLQEAAQQKNSEDNTKTVKLMTLHSAKGLEFDNVSIIGLEEETLPSLRSGDSDKEIEEDRRLFYVGITRAKERLLLSSTLTKCEYGVVKQKIESRFIEEIPENLLTKTHNFMSASVLKNQLRSWLENRPIKTELETLSFYEKMAMHAKNLNSKAIKKPEPTKVRKSYKSFAGSKPKRSWIKNSLVQHSIFGHGVVKQVQGSGENAILTIAFKQGTKKIAARFLKEQT